MKKKIEHKELDKRILTISKKIKKLRKDAGYKSYEKFAKEKGLPRMQYWRMENGTNFTIETFLKILDTHKLSITKFFK
ncbi:MAG: helix-turn-helix domain-containing protein [Bacteroidia bacterium]